MLGQAINRCPIPPTRQRGRQCQHSASKASRCPLTVTVLGQTRFVTEGIHAALEQATAAAGSRDVRLGGGVSLIRQYLRAALIDELHLALRPVLLGSGENLLSGIDMHNLGYEYANCLAGERATHVFLRKRT